MDSDVHFIEKAGGGLRPLALTSCLCKLFETMLNGRMQWWAKSQELLPPNQDGFRQGRSCADCVSCLAHKVEEAFSQKKDVLAAFLDIEAAFPGVNVDILLSL